MTFRPSVGRDPDDEAHALRVAVTRKQGMFEREGADFSYSRVLMDKSLPPTPDICRHRDSFDIMGWDYNPGDLILFHGSLLHGTAQVVVLEHDRRAYAALYAGPCTTYLQQRGQMVPDPPALAACEPQTGQPLDSFGDVFPLVWSPATGTESLKLNSGWYARLSDSRDVFWEYDGFAFSCAGGLD